MYYGLQFFSNLCEFHFAFSLIYFGSILISPRYHTYRLYSLGSKRADLFHVKSEGQVTVQISSQLFPLSCDKFLLSFCHWNLCSL